MTATRTRTRLTPEGRTSQLLDAAKQIIVESGLQRFTMESLAKAAGVSSPLVYKYFQSRQDLLKILLQREFQAHVRGLNDAVDAATSFEEVVRIFISSNYDQYRPGNILPILQSQPEIAASIKASQADQGTQVARYLVQNTARNYKLTRKQAELVVTMSSGASIAAAEYAARNKADREKVIDAALSYILAGLRQAATKNN